MTTMLGLETTGISIDAPSLIARIRAGLREGRLPDGPELAMVLHVACGLTVAVTTPFAPGVRHRVGAILVGLLAAVIGPLLTRVHWDRLGPRSQRLIIPEALVLVCAFNLTAGAPFVFSLFYLIVWVWIGLSQPPGTALRFTPLLLVAYLAPGLTISTTNEALVSAVYVVPVAVVAAETIAFVAEHLRRSREVIARSEARFAALVRHSSEFVLILDDDRQIQFASESIRSILGWSPEELIGTRARTLLHLDDAEDGAAWYRDATSGAEGRASEFRCIHADGTWRWIEGRVEDLRHDPAIGGVVVNGRDVSDRHEVEADLEWTAYTDELTGLPNRMALLRRLEQLVADRTPTTLLLLDLDRFKRINDSLGHPTGDTLLQAVTSRIAASTQELELFRLGGDEFVALGRGRERARQWAQQIVDCFESTFDFGGRRFHLSCSLGVVSATTSTSVTELLRTADIAMYAAKRRGGAGWSMFDDAVASDLRRRLDLENDLRVAIVSDELLVHFQPEVDGETGSIVGAEALVRWLHPARSWIEPGRFLPVAEETGLIDRVGHIVVERSLEAVRAWRRDDPGLFVSVNMSARQLRDPGFVDFIASNLALFDLPGAALRIELTEAALLEPEVGSRVLPALRELGVSIAIDGFGTGYSSLSKLRELTVDVLKTDPSFLPLVVGDEGAPLLGAVVAMAHGLGISVVAVGVETEEQRRLLRQLGCSRFQGHLVAPAMPARAFSRLLGRCSDGRLGPDQSAATKAVFNSEN